MDRTQISACIDWQVIRRPSTNCSGGHLFVVARVTNNLKTEHIGVQVANAAETAARKVRSCGHSMRSRTEICYRWTCARPSERWIVTKCSQKLRPIAPPFPVCMRGQRQTPLQSSFGDQQGDVLFATALQSVIEQIRELNLDLDIGRPVARVTTEAREGQKRVAKRNTRTVNKTGRGQK